MKRARRSFTAKYKKSIVARLLSNGETIKEIAEELEISPVVISRWKAEFKDQLSDSIEIKEPKKSSALENSEKSATISDVAQRAGVAQSTVSRVIHNNSTISTDTKERVISAMKELQYTPNAAAQNLARRKTKTLGLILPNNPDELFLNPFFIMVMRGFSIYAQEKGFNLMYAFSKDEAEEVDIITKQTSSGVIDGVALFTSRIDDKCIKYLKEKRFPFAIIGKPEQSHTVHWVDNDNFKAAYDATNTLINKGHTTIGFLCGSLRFDYAHSRLAGYKQALTTRGIQFREDLIVEGDRLSESVGYESMAQLSKHTKVDAVLAVDDFLAIGAMDYNEETKQKCAVIGFNNTLKGSLRKPSLTTVDVNPEQMGKHAAELLIHIVTNEESTHNHFIVETSLIERDSTQ